MESSLSSLDDWGVWCSFHHQEHPPHGIECRYLISLDEVQVYKKCLVTAVEVIEGLAAQQAMPDDWYEEDLAVLKGMVG